MQENTGALYFRSLVMSSLVLLSRALRDFGPLCSKLGLQFEFRNRLSKLSWKMLGKSVTYEQSVVIEVSAVKAAESSFCREYGFGSVLVSAETRFVFSGSR